jgi:hypothetical protein
MRPQTFRASKPSGPDGWGITNAELFFRESIYEKNWITLQLPGGKVPVLANTAAQSFPEVIRKDAAGRYGLTLDESQFETGWQKQKITFLRSTLIVNQGGSLSSGPQWKLQGSKDALYPNKWLEGFVNPYTATCW